MATSCPKSTPTPSATRARVPSGRRRLFAPRSSAQHCLIAPRSSAQRCLIAPRSSAQWVHHGQRQQRGAARADLDVGARGRAHAAVEARGPPAVVLLAGGERVLPVVPEPVALQSGVEVVPWQHLVAVALAGGEPR